MNREEFYRNQNVQEYERGRNEAIKEFKLNIRGFIKCHACNGMAFIENKICHICEGRKMIIVTSDFYEKVMGEKI